MIFTREILPPQIYSQPEQEWKWFLLRGDEVYSTQSSSFHIFFWTSVRVAQILVVAHKPHPPGLCILEAGWHSVIGWWRGAMPGQTGWGLGCHCKQSSAYSWNEITLWQWHCFAVEAACLFWTANPLASTSFPAAPPSSLPPLTAEVWLKEETFLTSTQRNRICHQHFHTRMKNLKG